MLINFWLDRVTATVWLCPRGPIIPVHCFVVQIFFQAKNNAPSLTSARNPDDPFNEEERERLQVEALAKKFENKYVSGLIDFFF